MSQPHDSPWWNNDPAEPPEPPPQQPPPPAPAPPPPPEHQPYVPPQQPYAPPPQPYVPPQQPYTLPSTLPQQPYGASPPQQPYPAQQYPAQPYQTQPYPGPPPTGWQPPPPPGQWDYLGGPAQPVPDKPRGRGRLIASIVAVVALAAGGVVTYVAVGNSSASGGSATPQAAVQKLVGDLNNSDLIGVLDDLVPAERDALTVPVTDEINQLKNLKVLSPNADPHSIGGVTVNVSGLTFASQPVSVTDSVQVVKVTGGTIAASADLAHAPLTKEFLNALFPNGLPASSKVSGQVDIAQEVQKTGEPLPIATQKVSGRWYPSLFYTVAYDGANAKVPSPSDYIAPTGASQPDGAVKQLISDALDGNVAGVIGLMSPDELAALHTYGGQVVSTAHASPSGVTLDNLVLATSDIKGGKRLTLNTITVTNEKHQQLTVTVEGDCVNIQTTAKSKRECPDDIVSQVIDSLKTFGALDRVTNAQRDALVDALSGLTSIGVDVSQIDGEWYVDGVRTVLDESSETFSKMKGNDVLELFGLFRAIGSH